MRIIFLEGNIGAGKSTSLKHWAEHLEGVKILDEPLDVWLSTKDSTGTNLLDRFYSDPERWGFTFQMAAFISRIQRILESGSDDKVVLMERSVFSDRHCFAKNGHDTGFIDEIEWDIYNHWFDWLTSIAGVDKCSFIYLQVDPETAYNRIQNRSRGEESSISQEYIRQLHDKHEAWLKKQKNVLVLDGSVPEDKLVDYVDEIRSFLFRK